MRAWRARGGGERDTGGGVCPAGMVGAALPGVGAWKPRWGVLSQERQAGTLSWGGIQRGALCVGGGAQRALSLSGWPLLLVLFCNDPDGPIPPPPSVSDADKWGCGEEIGGVCEKTLPPIKQTRLLCSREVALSRHQLAASCEIPFPSPRLLPPIPPHPPHLAHTQIPLPLPGGWPPTFLGCT